MASHTLSPLPYAFDALEPHIDALTMEIHHDKHHAAYVNNLNKAISGTSMENSSMSNLLMYASFRPAAVRNNAGGHYNHTLFWEILAPTNAQKPISEALQTAITNQFKSLDSLKTLMNAAAATRFGSGWAWLMLSPDGKLAVVSTANQDNPIMDVSKDRGIPLIGIDVWEHAYYLKYQNKRADYIQAFWNVINWDFVTNLYKMKTETSLLESVEMGELLKEAKSEGCSREDIETYRVLFNVNKNARNIYKNTIIKVQQKVFADKYHTKREDGEIPGVYNLEKPGRSVINYMNTNYSVFCIMVNDLNKVVQGQMGQEPISFELKTPSEQITEMKRMCNYIEKFQDRIFSKTSHTFKNIMATLKEKDSIGIKREEMAKKVLETKLPETTVEIVAGAGKEKDAYKKIDLEIVHKGRKITAQVKGFDELIPEDEKLVVTKTGEIDKYKVDWMVFIRGKNVLVFRNRPEIVLGQYVFDKNDLLYHIK